MKHILLRSLRFLELGIHTSIPALSLYWVLQYTDLSGIALVLPMFSILLIWAIAFVVFQQMQYPNNIVQALVYTGMTVSQFFVVMSISSIAFFAYVYFINTLIVLALLLLVGGVFIGKSTKVVSGKSWLILFLLLSGLATGYYVFTIFTPLVIHAQTLGTVAMLSFWGLFVAQILKLFIFQGRFFVSDFKMESQYALPKGVVLGVLLLGILATGFVVLF